MIREVPARLVAGIAIASTHADGSSKAGMSTPTHIGPDMDTPMSSIPDFTIGEIPITPRPIALNPVILSPIRPTTKAARLRFTRLRIQTKALRIQMKVIARHISNPLPPR